MMSSGVIVTVCYPCVWFWTSLDALFMCAFSFCVDFSPPSIWLLTLYPRQWL